MGGGVPKLINGGMFYILG